MKIYNNKIVIVCAIFVLLEMLDLSFINSVLGNIAQHFEIGSQKIDFLYITFSIGAVFAIPLAIFILKFESMVFLLKGLTLLLIFSFIITTFTQSWVLFCTLRFIQGFVLNLVYSVTYIYSIKHSNHIKQDINFINGVSITGMLSGPVLGGVFANINWQYIFIVLAILSGYCLKLITSCNIQPLPNDKSINNKKMLIEYCVLVGFLTSTTLLFQSSIVWSIKFVLIATTLFLSFLLWYKYFKFKESTFFNCNIFNKFLSYTFLINIFVRLVLCTVPLISFLLNSKLNLTTNKIAILLLISSIFSLFAKLLYHKYHYLFSLFLVSVFMSGIMVELGWIFYSKNNISIFWWSVIFAVYGFFGSILYNICNTVIYIKQTEDVTDSISLFLTLLQAISYGALVVILFMIYNSLIAVGVGMISEIIPFILCIFCLMLANYIYYKNKININI